MLRSTLHAQDIYLIERAEISILGTTHPDEAAMPLIEAEPAEASASTVAVVADYPGSNRFNSLDNLHTT